MIYTAIKREEMDNVIIIYLNNSADDQIEINRLFDELTEVCSEITRDENTRVIILTGARENSFSIGTHVIGMVSKIKEEQNIKLWSIAELIAKIDQPVIAAVNGDAFAHGLELVLACDLRICSQNARFAMPQVAQAKIPWGGGTQRLPLLVGKGKALELILTGETIDAQEAFRIGLVSKVVSSDELMVVAMDMAREMASKGPIALRYAKEAIHKGMDLTLEQGLGLEADLYLLIHTTKDRAEGIQAFREKRTPKFEGR